MVSTPAPCASCGKHARLTNEPHLDEVQVLRDDVLAVVHDEHTAHIQLDVVQLLAGVKHVKGSTLGHEQDGPAGMRGMTLVRKVALIEVMEPSKHIMNSGSSNSWHKDMSNTPWHTQSLHRPERVLKLAQGSTQGNNM
eukprot:1151686-Pelagomonas_calceolata.AAC.6